MHFEVSSLKCSVMEEVSIIERGRCRVRHMKYVVTSYNIQPSEVLEGRWREKGKERRRRRRSVLRM